MKPAYLIAGLVAVALLLRGKKAPAAPVTGLPKVSPEAVREAIPTDPYSAVTNAWAWLNGDPWSPTVVNTLDTAKVH